jgi:hypothetical protein
VPELGLLRVGEVDVAADHTVQQVLGEPGVHRDAPLLLHVVGLGLRGQDEGEGGHRLQPERLEVVDADHQQRIRPGVVEHLAEAAQRVGAAVELGRVLVGRAAQQLRGVHRSGGRDDLSHGAPPPEARRRRRLLRRR